MNYVCEFFDELLIGFDLQTMLKVAELSFIQQAKSDFLLLSALQTLPFITSSLPLITSFDPSMIFCHGTFTQTCHRTFSQSPV